MLLYACVVASLYLFFNGNCIFDNYRSYHEDDELDKSDYQKGLVVLILSFLDAVLGYIWPHFYFKKQEFQTSTLMVLGMIATNITIMCMMSLTEKCKRDTVENRYAIATGLYGVYTAWLVIVFSVSAVSWYRSKNVQKKKDQPLNP